MNSPSPELIELLNDHECAAFAAEQIRTQRLAASAVVPMLVEMIETQLCTTREIGELLQEFDSDLSQRIANWIAQLSCDDDATRERAVNALGSLGPIASAAVPALVKVLQSSPNSLACYVLGIMGPAAETAIPVLASLSASYSAAIRSLGEIGAAAVPTLIAMLDDMEKCGVAAEALGQIGPDAIAAVPSLLDYHGDGLREWNPEWTICRIGVAATPVLKHALLQDSDPHRRTRAANALGLLKADCAEAGSVLIEGLADADESVFTAVTSALDWEVGYQEYGEKSEAHNSMRSTLRLALQSKNPRLRVGAAATLALGPYPYDISEDVAVVLNTGLSDREACVRRLAAKTVRERAIFLSNLERALQDEDSVVRANAAVALCKMGRTSVLALVPVLVETLLKMDEEHEFWLEYRLSDYDLECAFIATGTACISALLDMIWMRAGDESLNMPKSVYVVRSVFRDLGAIALPHLRAAANERPELLTSSEFLWNLHDIEPDDVKQAMLNNLPEVRRAAASVIATKSQSQAWDVYHSYLCALENAFESETDEETLDYMACCLGWVKRGVCSLVHILETSTVPRIRLAAIRGLAECDRQIAVDVLKKCAVDDEDSLVQEAAAKQLRKWNEQ